MTLANGAAVIWSAEYCAQLERHLIDAIKFGWLNRRATPPRILVDAAAEVHQGASQYRPTVLTSGSGTRAAPPAHVPAVSEIDSEWLTTQAAAVQACISEGYVRRLCREHEVTAEWTAGGAWRIRADSLRAWSAHRTTTD